MRLLRNNSASAYSVCVYTETLGVFWRAWFSHSLLPCPFSSDYKSRWLQQFELKRIHFLLIQKVLRSPLTRAWPENRQACGERDQARPGWAGFILEDNTWQRIWRGSSNQMGTDEAHGRVLHAVSQQSDALMCLKGRVPQRVFSANSSSRSKPHDSQH